MTRLGKSWLLVVIAICVIAFLLVGFFGLPAAFRGGALHSLVRAGDLQGLRKAIQRGADPNRIFVEGDPPKGPGVTPAMVAAWRGDADSLTILLDGGATVDLANVIGKTALHYGVAHPHVLELLVSRGADINRATSARKTPLWIAVEIGHTPSVLYLLRAGASFGDFDCAVAEAAGRGHVETLGVLLEHHASLANDDWKWCLDSAAFRAARCLECLTLLLDYGADVDARGPFHETALMRAAEHAELEVVELLLRAGADPTLADGSGRTAAYYARHRKDGLAAVVEEMLIAARSE